MLRLSPRLWFAVYLAATLFFALGYSRIPSDFYHSTVALEESFQDLQDHLAEVIGIEFFLKYRQLADRKYLELTEGIDIIVIDENSHIPVVAPSIMDLRPLNDGYGFKLILEVISDTDGDGYPIRIVEKLPIDGRFAIAPESFADNYSSSLRDMSTLPTSLHFELDFSSIPSSAVPAAEMDRVQDMRWAQELRDFHGMIGGADRAKLLHLKNYTEGQPSDKRSVFPRMLYFSAVTITTLGYGDIVPLTNRARLLVASESLLGICIMGFFVNSVFQRRSLGRSSSGESGARLIETDEKNQPPSTEGDGCSNESTKQR